MFVSLQPISREKSRSVMLVLVDGNVGNSQRQDSVTVLAFIAWAVISTSSAKVFLRPPSKEVVYGATLLVWLCCPVWHWREGKTAGNRINTAERK